MAAALADGAAAPSITAQLMQGGNCLSCGASFDMSGSSEAQIRIKELEGQVELLTEKASAAGTWTLRNTCLACDDGS